MQHAALARSFLLRPHVISTSSANKQASVLLSPASVTGRTLLTTVHLHYYYHMLFLILPDALLVSVTGTAAVGTTGRSQPLNACDRLRTAFASVQAGTLRRAGGLAHMIAQRMSS